MVTLKAVELPRFLTWRVTCTVCPPCAILGLKILVTSSHGSCIYVSAVLDMAVVGCPGSLQFRVPVLRLLLLGSCTWGGLAVLLLAILTSIKISNELRAVVLAAPGKVKFNTFPFWVKTTAGSVPL